jgi:hypothetical protein
MAKSATAMRRAAKELALGPGVFLAAVELRAGDSYRIRVVSGERVSATVHESVEPALVEECMRDGRMVLVCQAERGPMIFGAVQTTRALACNADGTLAISTKEIRLSAEKTLRIEAGPVTISVDSSGTLRLQGDRMVLDMGALIRLLAARVELP